MISFTDVVDVDDVRVGEGGGRARLALEAGAEAGIGGELRPRRFDRHVAAEEEIVTEVDGRHAALAEAAPDAITTFDECLRLDHHARDCRPVDAGLPARARLDQIIAIPAVAARYRDSWCLPMTLREKFNF